MLRIDNLKLPVGAKEDKLRAACAHVLRVSEEALVSVKLLRRSIDAREGVKLVCSCAVEVKNESGVLRRCKNKNVQPYAPKKYTPPAPVSAPEVSPVVIGAGPAGLFCALLLARCGARPILLERGRAVEQRKRDVEHFWRTGELDLTSNVQFGGDALFVACAHRARQLEFSIRPARSISLRRGRGLRRRHHECRGRRPARRRSDFGGIEP